MLKTTLLTITLALLQSSAYADVFGSGGGYAQYRLIDGKTSIELGAGGSAQINEHVDVRGIASIINNGTDDNLRANIALVDIHTSDEELGIRIGRIQHELGFSTAQYNWAPSRDLYLPPQGIYRENFRYLVRSGDGAQLYTKRKVGDWYLTGEIMYSPRPVLYPMQDITKVWNGIGGTIDPHTSYTRGIHLSAESQQLNTIFMYDQQRLNFNIVGTQYGLFDGAVNTTGHYFGTKTELTDTVDVTLEYMRITKDGNSWEAMDRLACVRGVEYTMSDSVAYGAQLSWQVNPKYKVIGGVSAFYAYPADKHGKHTSTALGGKPQDYYSEDMYVGAKYRYDHWVSTLEWHHTQGTTTMLLADSKTKGARNNQVIFTVTYMF